MPLNLSHDDIIYAVLLLIGIAFGHFYRKVHDTGLKKLIGSALGLFIIIYTSRLQSLHLFLSFAVCYVILKLYEKKAFHLIIFWFMMSYLLFFRTVDHFNLPTPSGHCNMLQMILTMKIIGYAFEKSTVMNRIKENPEAILSAAEKEILSASFFDIFHYCFNYIGLLTGPYFTYKTFYDYFHLPFSKYADCWQSTLEKIKYIPLYAFLFIAASYIWPLEYALTSEFYESRSFLYRLFYVWPTFFIFRMRIYCGIILAECICTSAGMGAYPKHLESRCGHGPSKEVTSEIIEKADTFDYDFETIQNINVAGVEKCLTFREAMKHWNRCIQYWLAMNVYKRFPNKKYRVIATMAVSSYWHGVHAGYYFCILGPIYFLPLEDLYIRVLKSNNPQTQQIYNIILWLLKFFAFSYMGTAFLLKDVQKIWYYYSSVYHFAYFFWVALYVICLLVWKMKKSAVHKTERHSEPEHIKKDI